MDITSLLSPESSPPQTPEAEGSAASLDTSSQTPPAAPERRSDAVIALLDRQIAALSGSAPPGRRVATAGKSAQVKSKASSTLVVTDAATDTKPPPVKRKRKRRPTVKQLQVIHENRHDDSQLYNLTLDVNDLKQQVRNFLVHKSIHETRAFVAKQRFNAGVLRTTEHFFQVFRTGFREWEPQEAAFLAATLDQDVALGSIARGTTIFFDQWRRYKKMLQQRCFSISSTRILVSDSESCVVECNGEFEGRLTLAAITAVFPHILKDEELLSKVVNCRLICPTRTLIYFDESGRIVQYDAHADMFAGLNRILATNPMDVITLMANARISYEGSMIPNVSDDGVVDVDIEYDRSRIDQVEALEVEEEEEEERGGGGMVAGEGLSPYPSSPENAHLVGRTDGALDCVATFTLRAHRDNSLFGAVLCHSAAANEPRELLVTALISDGVASVDLFECSDDGDDAAVKADMCRFRLTVRPQSDPVQRACRRRQVS